MIKGYDVIGSIAILKFPRETSERQKKIEARKLLTGKNIKTVVEKLDKVSGRLRTIKTKYLAGKKTLETIHNESSCRFKLNIETCYFSPRLSNERLEVARMIKPNSKVLVLFAGVAPFSVIIAKYSNPKKVVSIELGRECCKYAKENIKLNKVNDKIDIVQGNVSVVVPKLKEKFDYIIMPRPQLEDSFLPAVFKVSRKNTVIVYYGFADNPEEIIEKIEIERKKAKKNIKILSIKRAGDIGPYRYRWRVDMTLLN